MSKREANLLQEYTDSIQNLSNSTRRRKATRFQRMNPGNAEQSQSLSSQTEQTQGQSHSQHEDRTEGQSTQQLSAQPSIIVNPPPPNESNEGQSTKTSYIGTSGFEYHLNRVKYKKKRKIENQIQTRQTFIKGMFQLNLQQTHTMLNQKTMTMIIMIFLEIQGEIKQMKLNVQKKHDLIQYIVHIK